MVKAYVFFCKPKSKWLILSPIIRKLQGLPFSHCAIYYNEFIYEAVWPHAKKTDIIEWLMKYQVVETQEAMIDPLYIEIMVTQKARYSILQLLWAYFDIKKMLNGAKGLICTEFVANAVNSGDLYPDSIDLKDIQSILKTKWKNQKS